MSAVERELWAWCGPCQRWLFVPKYEAEQPDQVTCPVCGEHPTRFESRGAEDLQPPVADDELGPVA